jgi:hypothetical protein
MKEALTTWALVAGIDVYDEPAVPHLAGAVADAVAAVQWLRRLGVPDGQILLHASPSETSRLPLDALGLAWQPATEPELWKSVARLRKVTGGTRLFVFLSGHGLYEPTTRRLFLTQEAEPDAWTNLGMDEYIELFRSMSFLRQFLFMDGCQNYPYAETARPTVAAAMHVGVTGYTARPGNCLVACFAAGQGQRALEVNGRGLFLRHLLDGLDLDHPWEGAVDLDFETGGRTVDLRKLVQECVLPKVEREARAQTPPLDQTPDFKDFGPMSASYPVVRLRDMPTVKVEVGVSPASAEGEVERVRVVVDEPLWFRQMPRLDEPLTLPMVSRLPAGLTGTVSCSLRQGAWSLDHPRQDFKASRDVSLTFEVRATSDEIAAKGGLGMGDYPAEAERDPDRGSSGPRSTAPKRGEEVLRVRTRNSTGAIIANTFNYEDIAQSFSLPGGRGAWRGEVEDGVTMEHHEVGPDFIVRSDRREDGHRIAKQWAKAIHHLTPAEVAVSFEVEAGAGDGPHLRIELPPGGARSLAGFVTGRSLVWVGLPGDEPVEPLWREGTGPGRFTLGELKRRPEMKLEPGPVRIRMELPWGNWTSVARIPERGVAMVSLPAVVGTPPLRVVLYREAGRTGTVLLGGVGTAPAARLRHGLGGKAGPVLDTADPRSAAWALRPAKLGGGASGQYLVEVDLEDGRRALFPLMKSRALALDLARGGVRVEALSKVPSPAWDLLIAAGRLDALDLGDVVALTYDKWKDWLLGLAGAYAVYARPSAHEEAHLRQVLENLTHLAEKGQARGQQVPDLDLLWAAFQSPGAKNPSEDAAQRLLPWAEKRAVPVLRWGVPIALQLLAGLPDEPFAGWRTALAAIEPRLSPISVWTAWTEPV